MIKIEQNTFEFHIEQQNVIPHIFIRLVIKPEYAFGEEGNEKFKIPPNATVEYIVTLKEFERGPETWKLTSEESLEQAKLVKDKATGYLKQEKYEIAIKLYEKANTFLENITSKCHISYYI